MIEGLTVSVYNDLRRGHIGLFITDIRKDAASGVLSFFNGKPPEFVEVQPGQERDPALRFTDDVAQKLADSLWLAGFKPEGWRDLTADLRKRVDFQAEHIKRLTEFVGITNQVTVAKVEDGKITDDEINFTEVRHEAARLPKMDAQLHIFAWGKDSVSYHYASGYSDPTETAEYCKQRLIGRIGPIRIIKMGADEYRRRARQCRAKGPIAFVAEPQIDEGTKHGPMAARTGAY